MVGDIELDINPFVRLRLQPTGEKGPHPYTNRSPLDLHSEKNKIANL